MKEKESEEKLIIYLLSFCALLMLLLYLFNQEALAATNNLNLLSKSNENHFHLKEAPKRYFNSDLSSVKGLEAHKEIKAAILWRIPDRHYILEKLSPELDYKRKDKALNFLNEREKQLNPLYERALKISSTNKLKRNLLRIAAIFKETQSLEKGFNAEKYIAKIKKEQESRLDNYSKLFSNENNFRENKLKNSIVQDFIDHYGIASTNYINQLFAKYPFYHETTQNKTANSLAEHKQQALINSSRYKIKINYGRLKLVSLGKEKIKHLELNDSSLIHIFKIKDNLLAVQALKKDAKAELVISTENKILNFEIEATEITVPDFYLEENDEIVNLNGISIEAASLVTIKSKNLLIGEIISSNSRALEFRQFLNSEEEDFLKMFLIKVNEEFKDLDLLISNEKKVYKLTLRIIKANQNGEKINEIVLD